MAKPTNSPVEELPAARERSLPDTIALRDKELIKKIDQLNQENEDTSHTLTLMKILTKFFTQSPASV